MSVCPSFPPGLSVVALLKVSLDVVSDVITGDGVVDVVDDDVGVDPPPPKNEVALISVGILKSF